MFQIVQHIYSSCPFFSDGFLDNISSPTSCGSQEIVELATDNISIDEIQADKTTVNEDQKVQNYVPPSAVALRCRVMPPPCLKNPYQKDPSGMNIDPFGNQRAKCAGIFSP